MVSPFKPVDSDEALLAIARILAGRDGLVQFLRKEILENSSAIVDVPKAMPPASMSPQDVIDAVRYAILRPLSDEQKASAIEPYRLAIETLHPFVRNAEMLSVGGVTATVARMLRGLLALVAEENDDG